MPLRGDIWALEEGTYKQGNSSCWQPGRGAVYPSEAGLVCALISPKKPSHRAWRVVLAHVRSRADEALLASLRTRSRPSHSARGPWGRSTGITRELVGNSESQSLPGTPEPQMCITVAPGEIYVRSTVQAALYVLTVITVM